MVLEQFGPNPRPLPCQGRGVGWTYPLAPSLQGRGMVALTPALSQGEREWIPAGAGMTSGWEGPQGDR